MEKEFFLESSISKAQPYESQKVKMVKVQKYSLFVDKIENLLKSIKEKIGFFFFFQRENVYL